MKKHIISGFLFVQIVYCQELQQLERVHGPTEFYARKIGLLASQVIPPLYTTYKVLEGSNIAPLSLGLAGLVWAGSIVAIRKIEAHAAVNCQPFECTVQELLGLISDFPEAADTLSTAKLKSSYECPANETDRKLKFSLVELEKMFGGYTTYYGLDSNDKPCGKLVVDVDNELISISHPLITYWAKNKHYWKHWPCLA